MYRYVARSLTTLALLLLTPTLLFAAFDSAVPAARSGEIQVVGINPAGADVPAGRELVIHFNRPVVPVGRMERTAAEVPVTIDPPLACSWRWLNSSSLACQLPDKEPLTPATSYTVKIKAGLKAEDGAQLKLPYTHSFSTERPRVMETHFENWQSAGHPLIRVWFNQPVKKGSVETHLYFRTANGRRIPLKAAEDSERKKKKKTRKGATNKPVPHDGRYWFVEPAEELPLDAAMELKVEPGIAPRLGKTPGGEERVVVAFNTFPLFSFVGVRCYNNEEKEITLIPGREPRLGELCNPLNEVALLFSAPVINNEIKAHLKLNPDLAGGRKDYDPWENAGNYSRLSQPHTKGASYPTPLPEMLRANSSYTVRIPAGKLRDEFGRPLLGGAQMTFATDHRKPNYAFDHHYSVLEKKVDSELPIVVTNLAQINVKYAAMTGGGKVTRGEELLEVSPALDISYPMPLGVREMLKSPSGIITGEIFTAPPLSGKTGDDRWFFSQVTPFNIQVKVGHFSTLVWVTDFATGLPVAGARVDLAKGKIRNLPTLAKGVVQGVTDQHGIVMFPGTEKLDPELKLFGYGDRNETKLFVRCRKGGDIALVPLIEEFGAYSSGGEEEGSYAYLQQRYEHMHTWGTTAQGIYKSGDTVQYKIYVRNQDNRAFVPPPRQGYGLKVIDPLGKVVHEIKKLSLNEFGSCDGSFDLPKSGAVGWYRFVLTAKFRKGEWEPLQVLVSDFTPSPFRVTSELNGKLFRSGDQVKVTTLAKLHAGGPYANAMGRVTALLKAEPFTSEEPRAKGYQFDTFSRETRGMQQLFQQEGAVDAKGERVSDFTLEPNEVLYGRIIVESAVRDDRGKYIAGDAGALFVGRDRFVGLAQADWVLKAGEPTAIKALVVDEQGNIAPGSEIKLTVEYRKTVASRVKGAGNAYLTHFDHEWVKVKECTLQSAAEGVECLFTPASPGLHRMTATIADTLGRGHTSQLQRWTVGKGAVVWDGEATNNLTIIPEKKEYRVGDTARFLVQNPYPGARALVTVERYGILKSWVTTLKDASATVEYQVEPDAVPGFHLSVVIVSPRVAKPLGNNQVDLGKPAFRIGYVPVTVTDQYKELQVEALPDKKSYRPRDTVTLDLHARPRRGDPGTVPPPVELAVAVLDEAVFDLIKGGRSYFDVYKGFYYLDPLDVKNFNILMQLIGRQKFEKKGASAGGDGGLDLSMRSSFKFVSYWNPSLKADPAGRARVQFTLPDNLTGWRVLVMAVTPGDLMGLGDTSFTVNTPIELRPVMPNQVTEGDRVEAGFTVMNRTGEERTLDLAITATGPLENGGTASLKQKLVARPFIRNTFRIPLKTVGSGTIVIKARAGDQTDFDALEHSVPVLKRQVLETAATFGTTTAATVSEQIAFPSGIRTDVGKVSVSTAPTVIGNLEGAFRYLRDYPYVCWEQKLTKGVMASHYRQLHDYLSPEFSWPGSTTLPAETLKLAAEHQAPGGGMSYYVPSDSLASPYLSAYTALAFNWLRAAGHSIPEQVENRLHDYLLNMLRNNTMPTFYSKGMASTVRGVALAALAPKGKITVADVKRYRTHLPEMSLFGKAHYLQALLKVKGTDDLRAETARMILAHASETGGKYIFSETLDDGYKQLLASPLRDNAAILSALVAYGETPGGKQLVGDIPHKLVRAITQTRGNRDRWENTQENMFAMNALTEFRRVYEREKPAMTVTASFDGEKLGSTRFSGVRDRAGEFERPLRPEDPGRKGTVTLAKEGAGRLYYATRLSYSPVEPKKDPVNAGIEVQREYSVERNGQWQLLSSPLKLKSGELVRIDLFLSLRAPRNFVVVEDPVPGGLEAVNRDLATSSTIDAAKGEVKQPQGSFWYRHTDWIDYGYSFGTFYHRELRHQAARFYSEYLPAGNYHLSYVAQAIAPGEFAVLPTRAEEMYEPDVYGLAAPALLRVE